MANTDNYRLLIQKLDHFIRKYYANQVIRGILYSIGLVLVLFLGLNFVEHYSFLKPSVKTPLVLSFLVVSLLALGYWVFKPMLHFFRLGKLISHEQAASIIGSHFNNVQDKLLNVLQLKQQSDRFDQKDLILASIDQKSEEIKLVPFRSAIDFSKNRKYLRYALPPLLLLLILLFAAPSLIKDSTRRLINNKTAYEKPAPFTFVVDKEALSVVQFDDYPLTVKVEGAELPNEVFVVVEDYRYRLSKVKPNEFAYRFSNVQKETDFKLFSTGIESEAYTLSVLEKPNILGFELQLDYPGYTGRQDETLKSIGDVVVPAGTHINWEFEAQSTDEIRMDFSSIKEQVLAKRFSDELFSYKKRALKDETYKLFISNEDLPNADSISYSITVVPDLFPTIKVESFKDSTDNKLLFFVGEASDDYGLKNLSFNYRVKQTGGSQGELNTIPLQKSGGKQIQYDYTFDIKEINLQPGDEVTYYFEIFDNDGVSGSKSARTNVMIFAKPTVEEFETMAEENNEEIKEDLKKALEEARKIQEDMKKMREKLLQEKDLDWQNKKELEKLLERQKELQQEIEKAKESYDENLKNQEEFSKVDEKILEKQEKLQEFFDEVMNDEMKELMKQIEDLLQELEKDEALEMMEDFEMNDEELEMELDRMLELFKQLELEKDMMDAIDELEELAKEQEELSEETEKEESSEEELQEKQEEINEEFEDIKEKMEEIEKKNEELENPKSLEDHEEEMEDIQKDLDDSQEQLEQKNKQNASKSQKKAAQKMQEMAAAMAMAMEAQEMEQMEEDMESLRQLLENLVGLSFDQEDLMDEFGLVTLNTPAYVELVQEQFKLEDDFKLVQDSLQALSKRVVQIESFVTEKVTDIKQGFRSTIEDLEERKKPEAAEHQQRVMKNVNDLALMLSEVMNQMQQQMSGMMAGSQMCTKPGGKGKGSKPSDKISEGQKSLNEQMKKMKDGMKNGGPGSSKEFAQMAAKQAALRKALREKQKKQQEQGKGDKELEQMIEQMNKVEIDLVNKRLTNQMLKRQEDILTRLLEHEKAERQRKMDQERKAESASQKERKYPPSLEEYLKKREAEIEMYKTVSPTLKPYYKSLVEQYFKSLKEK